VRFLQRRVGSHNDAEDLFQDTFVRVCQNFHHYDDRRSFKTWLFTIAWRLITSAEDISPSYSEHLHQRTMRAIRAQQTRMTVEPRSNWNHAVAAAAAVLLLGLCAWYFAGGKHSQTSQQVASRTHRPVVGVDVSVPGAGDLLRHGSKPLADALSGIDGNGLAQLEQDARSLARFIANQFPLSDPRSSTKSNQQAPQPGT
jgi:RNA polymerase sigma factor (sigma-70 family)